MSSSSASSHSPEPVSVPKNSKKGKAKSKKVKIAQIPAETGKNERIESEDADLAYKAPEGYVLMKHATEETEFDWDAINNDDNLELWVIRVPDGVSAHIPPLLAMRSTSFVSLS